MVNTGRGGLTVEYPDMITGEWYEDWQIAVGAEFVLEHPTEPSWGFYKLTNADDYGGRLACLVNADIEHASENYRP